MTIDHALKQRIYAAAEQAFKLAKRAAQEAARHRQQKNLLTRRMHVAAARDLLYQATVALDEARDSLDDLDEDIVAQAAPTTK